MTIREALAQENPEALVYPERFDVALVTVTIGFGPKGHTRSLAVYDHGTLSKILAAEFVETDESGEDRDELDLLSDAEEWIDYDMAGAYLGPDAPLIVKIGAGEI